MLTVTIHDLNDLGELLVEAVSPVALEVALNVQQELQCRVEEADRLRQKPVERAQYEADLARRRYMRVDPDNRLVADSLEAEWNSKLRTLSETQQQHSLVRHEARWTRQYMVVEVWRKDSILLTTRRTAPSLRSGCIDPQFYLAAINSTI